MVVRKTICSILGGFSDVKKFILPDLPDLFSKYPDREPEFPDASEEHIPDLILRTESFSGRLPVLCPRKTGAFHKDFVLFGCSGVAAHKGAYGALFKVRCMVAEHMAIAMLS